ncbi:protein of unknown function (plasmid) [Caballeronia sp. S22]
MRVLERIAIDLIDSIRINTHDDRFAQNGPEGYTPNCPVQSLYDRTGQKPLWRHVWLRFISSAPSSACPAA